MDASVSLSENSAIWLWKVKELGVVALNCSCLTQDLAKVFSIYWTVAKGHSTLPSKWPSSIETGINFKNPLKISINGTMAETTFGVLKAYSFCVVCCCRISLWRLVRYLPLSSK